MLGLYSFFSIAMVINMFITQGRAGQVAFFAMIAILILQYFKGQRIKTLIVTLILIPVIFITALQTSPHFKQRALLAIDEIVNYDVKTVAEEQSILSSTGARILFA